MSKKPQNRIKNLSTHQELVWIGSSGLTDKDPGTSIQLHLVGRPLDAGHLRICVTVEVEHHLVVPHSNGEPGPGVPHRVDAEAGRFVRALRAGFRVVEDDVLVVPLHS